MITLEAQKISYGGLFERLSFRLEPGERLGILGPSGTGKTTLLQLILGHIRPTSGIVTWNGRPIHSLFRRRTFRVAHPIGLVLQNAALAFNPGWSIRDCLLEPIPNGDSSANVRIAEHMDALQLSMDMLERRSDQLSGGQLQRMQLIRAVLTRPHLLLLDEPISQLDGGTKAIVSTWLDAQIRQLNSTAVIVSHDEQWLRTFVDHVLDIDYTQLLEKI